MTAVNRGPTPNMTKGPLFLRYATVFITRTRKPQPRGILYILSIIWRTLSFLRCIYVFHILYTFKRYIFSNTFILSAVGIIWLRILK
jgi:hypothetical protein